MLDHELFEGIVDFPMGFVRQTTVNPGPHGWQTFSPRIWAPDNLPA
jgi:hypothetical protein